MKLFFYPRLAFEGLRKNRRLSVPYLLTCICMAAVFYILSYLSSPEALALVVSGRSTVETIMQLGRAVIALFSLIFLFYTYSFLLRRRSGEFGLYNVLGMGKWNLVRIMSWESLITFAISLFGGLLLGIILSGLAELGLLSLLGEKTGPAFHLNGQSVLETCMVYAAIFALLWISAVIRTFRNTAVSLMKSENTGEKPPKGNWLFALLGLFILAAAYFIAVTVTNSLSAMTYFFFAVLMVIIATYMIMIAGSVKLCRVLQGNKDYYYKAKHFVSVSSMAFRMKRNGAGLASICIISTMILVILSATTCMWFGVDDSLRNSYPRDIDMAVYLRDPELLGSDTPEEAAERINAYARDNGISLRNIEEHRIISIDGIQEKGFIRCDVEDTGIDDLGRLREVYMVPASAYPKEDGTPLELGEEETYLIVNGMEYTDETITLVMGEKTRTWKVLSAERNDRDSISTGSVVPTITMIVPDLVSAISAFDWLDENGIPEVQFIWKYNFDTGLTDAENIRLDRDLREKAYDLMADLFPEDTIRYCLVDSRAAGAADFYGLYGSLFFIGILLSIVFLIAAVLIIYYKQISEGYEDARRFDIMRKVGMTKEDIRSSISSQLLIVFALPLAFAGIHLIFAFPMIRKMLALFNLTNLALFIRTTMISFLVFALFYGIVYRLTSGVYYRIVSGVSEQNA